MSTLGMLLGALNATAHFNGTSHNNGTVVHNSTDTSNQTNPIPLQPLAFTSPSVNITTLLRYNVGDMVNVSWTSPFEHTTVQVWQGPSKEGVYAMQTIAANFTRHFTTVFWKAETLGNSSLDEMFHFQLQKGHRPNECARCVISGPTFQMQEQEAGSPSISPSPSAEPAPSGSSLSEGAKLGIGLGVGLGVGFLLLLAGTLFFFLKRRHKRREKDRDLAATKEKQDQLRHSSAENSLLTRSSGVTYHSKFDFENPDGTPQEGWESLWHRIFGRR